MKKVLTIAALVAVSVGIASAAGVWKPESPRYWREKAQTALLWLAGRAPEKYAGRVARAALRTHPQGVDYSDMESAAELFAKVGEKDAAATLWLGLAQVDAASGNPQQAESHVSRAAEATQSERAYLSGVVIHRYAAAKRAPWVAALRQHYPHHAVARAFSCVAELQSLEDALPGACFTGDWIGQRAANAKTEFARISSEIEQHPQNAAAKIREIQSDLESLTAAQRPLVSRYQALGAELDRLEKNGAWDAAGLGLLNAILPLPQPGDTFEIWLTREGICLLPGIRWFCRINALAQPFAKLQRDRERLTRERESAADDWRRNESAIASSRSSLNYWSSEAPLEELRKSRDGVLPGFRSGVEAALFARYTEVGIAPPHAIALAMGTAGDGSTVHALISKRR